MIIVGAISLVAIFMMIVMLLILYFRRGKKKLPPADVIPEVSKTKITILSSLNSVDLVFIRTSNLLHTYCFKHYFNIL